MACAVVLATLFLPWLMGTLGSEDDRAIAGDGQVLAPIRRHPTAVLPASPIRNPGPPVETRSSILVALDAPSVVRSWIRGRQGGLPGDASSVRAVAHDERMALARLFGRVTAAQRPILRAVEVTGARVVSRYRVAVNGLLVHATADQMDAIRRIDGVLAVHPAPLVRPNLERTASVVGARNSAAALGYDGAGTVVAIIDTGIDYTHATFGGPGTPDAYRSAASAADRIDDLWDGRPLFPNQRVIGGYDFVGPNYTAPAHCSPADEAAGRCTSTPHPDGDPLDGHGHGTHVAGIVAGRGSSGVAPGIAPEARLVGLKLYGPPQGGIFPDEAVDVLIDAIEWCTAANLGLETRGTVPDHIDVANISLGEPWGQGSRLFDEAARSAGAVGITVVASAGNARDVPYVVGAPASSPLVLAVAGSLSPTEGHAIETSWSGGSRVDAVSVGSLASLLPAEPLTANLRVERDPCETAPQAIRDLAGAVVVTALGSCALGQQVAVLRDAGARGVLVHRPGGVRVRPAGDPTQIGIPVIGIGQGLGTWMERAIARGVPISVTLAADIRAADPESGLGIASFSSRGPARAGALKPNISAPGSGVRSADIGTGHDGTAISGTSMSSPVVAGAAALVRQRVRTQGLDLSGVDAAALLAASARPMDVAGGPRLTVARQGAGRVDIPAALTAPILVRAGSIADIHLEALAVREPVTLTRMISITNLQPSDTALQVTVRPRAPADAAGAALGGLTVLAPRTISIQSGATADLPVTFRLDPADLPGPWDGRGEMPDSQRMDPLVGDGWIEMAMSGPTAGAVGRDGVPTQWDPDQHYVVPYRVLARGASDVAVTRSGPRLLWRNAGAIDTTVRMYRLLGDPGGDPDEADIRHELDLAHVAARFVRRAEGPGRLDHLALAVVRHEPAALPNTVRIDVHLDVDDDGTPDTWLSAGPESAVRGAGSNTRTVVGLADWDADRHGPVGPVQVVGLADASLHTRVAEFEVPLGSLGLEGPVPLGLRVEALGLDETWWAAERVDRIPDAESGPSALLRLTPASPTQQDVPGSLPFGWTARAGQGGIIPWGGRCDRSAESAASDSWLAVVLGNPADARIGPGGQAMILPATAADRSGGSTIPAGACRAFIPFADRAE